MALFDETVPERKSVFLRGLYGEVISAITMPRCRFAGRRQPPLRFLPEIAEYVVVAPDNLRLRAAFIQPRLRRNAVEHAVVAPERPFVLPDC